MKNSSISFETEGDVLEEAKSAFNTLISTLEGEPSFAKYKFGIVKMFDFFKEEYDKNVKLLIACQEKNAQIVINATKINMIQKSTFSDAENLHKLKLEFDEAINTVQSVHKSEMRSKHILNDLRIQIKNLNQRVQNGEAFSFNTNQSIFETSNEVKNLRKELNKATDECKTIKEQIQAENDGLEQAAEQNKMLSDEHDKLSKTIAQVDKRLSIIQQENDETSQTILELKPVLESMATKTSDLAKKKLEIQGNIQQVKDHAVEMFGQINAAKDESRQRKDKLFKKVQRLTEMSNVKVTRKEMIESTSNKLKAATNQLVDMKTLLENEGKKLEENNKTIDEEFKKSDDIAAERNKTRLRIKELRPKVVDALIKLSEYEGIYNVLNRQTDAAKVQLTDLKQHGNEIKHQIKETKNTEIALKSEIVGIKTFMQEQKDKIIEIFQEIDETRTAVFKTQANILCVKDANQVMVEENEKLMKEHANLMKKSERQTSLSDQKREERNVYARQLKAKEDENNNLIQSINELETVIASCKSQSEKLFNNIIDSHFNKRNDNDMIDNLNLQIEEIKQHTRKVERVTSHLQAENQTLNYIIREAQTDHILIEKEKQLLDTTISTMNEKIKQRQLQTNEVFSNAAYLEKLIEGNRIKYNEKVKELKGLYSELETRVKVTEQLEKKADVVDHLHVRMQKISSALAIEKRKYIILVHELAIPRNVHRWQVIEAVDPRFVRSIRFRMELSDKFERVMEELRHLQKERDRLKEQIESMNKEHAESLTKKQVEIYIEKYKEDIKRKDEEIAAIEMQIKNQLNPIKQSSNDINTMREKVNKRRESACSLKNEIYETSRSADYMFITEGEAVAMPRDLLMPPRPLIAGGGFHVVITPKPQRRGAKSSNILKVGTSPVYTRNPTTMCSTRSCQGKKYLLPPMPLT